MSLLVSQQEIIIQAPARLCFEHFSDVTLYPQWESSARQVQVLERNASGQPSRVSFCYEKRLLLYTYRLSYSLRCHLFEQGSRYWIKFDEAEGDLEKVMTIVEFSAEGDGCRMAYRGVIEEQLPIRRALVAFFGPRELRAHLDRFKAFMEEAVVREAAVG